MPDFLVPNDMIATVPIDFEDSPGHRVKPPAGGAVTSSDPTILTAELLSDGGSVIITPVADGVGVSVTYANSGMPSLPPVTLLVDVIEPSPTSDAFDVANATFAPKP